MEWDTEVSKTETEKDRHRQRGRETECLVFSQETWTNIYAAADFMTNNEYSS